MPNTGKREAARRLLAEKGLKVCSKCESTKAIWEFREIAPGKYLAQCRDCFNSIRRYK